MKKRHKSTTRSIVKIRCFCVVSLPLCSFPRLFLTEKMALLRGKKRDAPLDLEEQQRLRGTVDAAATLQAQVESVLGGLRPRYDGAAAKAVEDLARDVREVAMSPKALRAAAKALGSGMSDDLLGDRVCVARPAKPACVRLDAASLEEVDDDAEDSSEDDDEVHHHRERTTTKKKLSFATSDAAVVGSWLTRSCLKGNDVALDVCCALPSALLVAKDAVNGRYFEKRWAYVKILGRALQDVKGLVVTVKDLGGDARRPILVVRRPEVERLKQFSVNVMVAWPEGTLPFRKLGPLWNACRSSENVPTPRYNDALLRDCASVVKRHVEVVFEAVRQTPGLGDAIVLAKAWLFHHGHLPRPDGIDATFVALLCAHAVRIKGKKKREASSCVSVTIFRSFLKFILEEWGPTQPRALFSSSDVDLDEGWSFSDYQTAGHDLIFLDPKAHVNLAARLSTQALSEIQRDASLALAKTRLDAAPNMAFVSLFPSSKKHSTPKPAYLAYDAIVRVPIRPLLTEDDDDDDDADDDAKMLVPSIPSQTKKKNVGRRGAWLAFPREKEALGEPLAEAVGRFAAAIVDKALESRHAGVRALVDLSLSDNKHLVSSFHAERPLEEYNKPSISHVAVGVILRRDDAAFRPALRGPRPDDVEGSRAFRDFWGDKAQLRRFRDGAVVEAVVWDEPESSGLVHADWKRALPERAVRFALGRHLESRCSDAARRQCNDEDRAALARATFDGGIVGVASRVATVSFSTTPGALRAAVDRLDAACRRLCGPGESPLRLDALSAAAPLLRGTAPLGEPAFDPRLAPPQRLVSESKKETQGRSGQVVDLVARFERSGKWAGLTTAAARRAAAYAFVASLATKLAADADLAADLRFVGFVPLLEDDDDEDHHEKTSSDSSDDKEGKDDDLVAAPHLRVLFAGFAFRLSPIFPRALGTKAAAEARTVRTRTRRLDCPSLEPMAVRELSFVHHATIRAACAQFPSLAATVRLLSRWCAAQLFSGHVSHEALELLAAFVFKESPANSPVAGFLRCLRLLWSHDWAEPLVIDFRDSDDDPEESIDHEERALAMAMRVEYGDEEARRPAVTSFLRLDVAPEKPVLRLIQAAARETERVFGQRWLSKVVVDDHALDILEAAIGRKGGKATRRAFDAWFILRKDVVSRGILRLDDLETAAKAIAKAPKAFQNTKKKVTFANLKDDDDKTPDRAFAEDRDNAVLDPRLAPETFAATDPVADFVDDLRQAFGRFALFFYDALEPTLVGVVWRPFKARPFSASNAAYMRPVVTAPQDKSKKKNALLVEPNFDQILHDCALLGSHLVLDLKKSRSHNMNGHAAAADDDD